MTGPSAGQAASRCLGAARKMALTLLPAIILESETCSYGN
jgi:hypothetical protein